MNTNENGHVISEIVEKHLWSEQSMGKQEGKHKSSSVDLQRIKAPYSSFLNTKQIW